MSARAAPTVSSAPVTAAVKWALLLAAAALEAPWACTAMVKVARSGSTTTSPLPVTSIVGVVSGVGGLALRALCAPHRPKRATSTAAVDFIESSAHCLYISLAVRRPGHNTLKRPCSWPTHEREILRVLRNTHRRGMRLRPPAPAVRPHVPDSAQRSRTGIARRMGAGGRHGRDCRQEQGHEDQRLGDDLRLRRAG